MDTHPTNPAAPKLTTKQAAILAHVEQTGGDIRSHRFGNHGRTWRLEMAALVTAGLVILTRVEIPDEDIDGETRRIENYPLTPAGRAALEAHNA